MEKHPKMSRWGVGPVFAAASLGYGAVMLALSGYFYPLLQIHCLPYRFLVMAGAVLIVIGIPFWLIAAASVMRAYNADSLVTSGVFRWCRHPLYASWVVFIAPGIVLLLNSWPLLTTPLFMYFLLRRLVRREEEYLAAVFGTAYLDYQARVPCILPYGRLKQRGRERYE